MVLIGSVSTQYRDHTDIVRLGHFVAASYVGLGILLAFHSLLLLLCGIRPWRYMRRAAPVLGFAFTSRSSAASIPLNVTTQTRHLGVPESIASLAASLGATMGQNGCAGPGAPRESMGHGHPVFRYPLAVAWCCGRANRLAGRLVLP